VTGSTEHGDSASPEPEQRPSDEPWAAATADLQRLQALLRRAAQGQADVGQVKESLRSYWQDNGAALTTAAAALSDEVRRQMLAELYEMRSRLGQQLGNRTSPPPRGRAGTPPPRQDPGG
jgi:hypothetical protein